MWDQFSRICFKFDLILLVSNGLIDLMVFKLITDFCRF